jgi:hypothetical protein
MQANESITDITDNTGIDLPGLTRHEVFSIAGEVAAQLDETARKPRKQIESIVAYCGVEFTLEVLQQALEIEAKGGMMISSGDRRRTPGGVFFFLARDRMPNQIRQEIFYTWQVAANRRAAYESQFPAFEWDERVPVLEHILAHGGEVSEVRIHLIGRPGEIERREGLVITAMQFTVEDTLAFPAGVPRPPQTEIGYAVYISSKQWEKVAEAIEDPKDELMIEGLCDYDAEVGSLAVFATHVTTRKLQRQAKKQAKEAGSKKQSGDHVHGDKARRIPRPMPAAPPPANVDLPPGLPPQVARKLTELHTAAASFQQKITALEAKPAGQQFGLEMMQKLLKNTQKQIETLEKQYVGEG